MAGQPVNIWSILVTTTRQVLGLVDRLKLRGERALYDDFDSDEFIYHMLDKFDKFAPDPRLVPRVEQLELPLFEKKKNRKLLLSASDPASSDSLDDN